MERFVLIDLSISKYEPTRVTAFERDGWKMRALGSLRVERCSICGDPKPDATKSATDSTNGGA